MKEDLKEILKKSGNNLHIDVVDLLETMEWDVDLSSYYYDDTANKPREIDIIALKEVEVFGDFGKAIDKFKLFLFIECKYFKNEIAFRMRKNNDEEGKEAIIIEGLNKKELLDSGSLFRKHHYRRKVSVGKLYDSDSGDQKAVFDAVTQPIKSLTFSKERGYKMEPETGFVKAIYYPIVVYAGIDGIYGIKNKETNLDKLSPDKELIFGLNYSYRSVVDNKLKNSCFYIDFIHRENLEDFIEGVIDKESSELQESLAWMQRMQKTEE